MTGSVEAKFAFKQFILYHYVMNPQELIRTLKGNSKVFESFFNSCSIEERLFKPKPNKWNIHIVLCHLLDEETLDFRARLNHALTLNLGPLPTIDPKGLVEKSNYASWNYDETLNKLLVERAKSLELLNSIKDDQWDNAWVHEKYGPLSVHFFLTNWVAHDYLHTKQLLKLKYDYLATYNPNTDLQYAGEW